ncbi:MAG TPA: ABC transporter permease [Edaphobacter sp.]|uniref:ABC transporter permease n=1 Tax=Edaphobacter sp. TaxID=1934404 RepID=UPI002BD4E2C0|nr:ABC transporter permease [Edaphobacter sp.]HUZ96319.1 ABC transporter permease [Edaphobacter sp.]
MRALNRFFSRLWNLSSGQRGDQRLREEMEEHVTLQTEENLRAGMAPAEAHRQALLKFGAVGSVRESYHAEEGLPFVEGVLQDFRYGIRLLRKSRGFTAAAVLTLALGIGANLAVFLVLYGVLLKPLPFPSPRQLVRIERSYSGGTTVPAYSGTKALFFQRASHAFTAMAAYDYVPSHANLVQGDGAVPISVLRVTSDFFRVFEMEPAMGRGFRTEDMVLNAPAVVVLSDALWRHQFGGDPEIVGKALSLGNRSYTVVGVANRQFALDTKADAWIPLAITESPGDQSNNYNVVARLKSGVTESAATADLRGVLLELKTTYPDLWDRYEGVRVEDLHDSFTGDLRPALRILMGAVGLLFLIVAANILSLLLTRAVSRRREMSIRVALGATSWRMLRQLLVENASLCILGGVTGIALAWIGAPVLMHLSPLQIPQFASLGIGGPALAFAAVLTLGCVLLFSLVPALETRRVRLNETLQLNTTRIAAGRHLTQKVLVVSEVAVSLVLLVGAALLLTTFWKIIHTPPGFVTRDVLTFKNSFTDQQAATSASLGLRLNELKSRIEALPGVTSVAAASTLPTQLVPDLPFDIVGRPSNRSDAKGDEKYIPITAGFFRTLGIPIMAGRAFTGADTNGSLPVLIVNQQFAETYFRNENPVGQRVLIGKFMGPGFEDPVREIVGVVGNVKQVGLDQPAPGIMYLPAEQIPDLETRMANGLLGESWVVRTESARVDVLPAIRRIFMENSHAPLLSVEPMNEVISASVAQQRFSMILLCGFGLISLVLGAAGLYGVMSYNVQRQKREIGVRMALGARRQDIAGMVLRDAGVLVGIGLVIGIAASLLGAKLVGSLLFGVKPRDPLTLAAASAVLLLTGLCAAWWPARRAARVDPMDALRSE